MSSQQTHPPRNERQRENLKILRDNFGVSDVDLDRVRFFSEEDAGWIPPDLLQAIALKKVEAFSYIGSSFQQYIQPLDQVVWTARVIDEIGRTFERSGVATMGEAPKGEIDLDAHTLANGRALSAVLSAAGFHPFKAGSLAKVERLNGVKYSGGEVAARTIFDAADAAELRGKDLRQIHALAERVGLIVGKDQRGYRAWLVENYRTTTAALMDATMRASVINALTNFEVDVYLAGVPQELRADAAIA